MKFNVALRKYEPDLPIIEGGHGKTNISIKEVLIIFGILILLVLVFYVMYRINYYT